MVGVSTDPNQTLHLFASDCVVMTDLGPVGSARAVRGSNTAGQVVAGPGLINEAGRRATMQSLESRASSRSPPLTSLVAMINAAEFARHEHTRHRRFTRAEERQRQG